MSSCDQQPHADQSQARALGPSEIDKTGGHPGGDEDPKVPARESPKQQRNPGQEERQIDSLAFDIRSEANPIGRDGQEKRAEDCAGGIEGLPQEEVERENRRCPGDHRNREGGDLPIVNQPLNDRGKSRIQGVIGMRQCAGPITACKKLRDPEKVRTILEHDRGANRHDRPQGEGEDQDRPHDRSCSHAEERTDSRSGSRETRLSGSAG
jgi:hypothetical protein